MSDFIPHQHLPEDDAATEKMVANSFRRQFTAYIRSDIPRKLTDLSEVQLPTNSVLHVADQLLDMNNPSIAPDVTNHLLVNEDFLVYMGHVTKIPGADDPLFPVTDRYRFLPARFTPQIQKFNQTSKVTRRMPSVSAAMGRSNVLSCFNYNPIFKTYLTGRMVPLRKFQIMLNAMLAHIAELDEAYPGKYHHIQIPVSLDVYTKVQYDRAFKEFTPGTIRIWDDPSYYFMIHLLGFLADAPVSLFRKLPQGLLDRLHVILTCGPDQAVIYNLGDLLAMKGTNKMFYLNPMRHVNLLKFTVSETLGANPDEELPDESEFGNDTPVDEEAIQAGEVDDYSDDAIDRLVEIHARTDAPTNADTEISEDVSDEDDQTVRPEEQIAPPIKVSSDEVKPAPAVNVKTEQETQSAYITSQMKSLLENPPVPLSTTQRERALEAMSKWRSIDVGGVPLTELLTEAEDPNIHEKDLEEVTKDLPDASMAKSSISTFDKVYIEKQLKRDVAATIASFAANGFIVQDVVEHKELTEFNRIHHYAVSFVDLQGKRHKVQFKFPVVSEKGTMVINGVKSRMVKQQVNLPICKVSPVRVNLSSNFNKTLVERNASVAHQFDASLARHLATLKRAGLIKFEFGQTSTKDKVPYDYAALMARYTAITMGDYSFTFDYNNRLGLLPDEIAVEAIDQRELYQKYREGIEAKFGVFCGQKHVDGKPLWSMFYGKDNVIRVVETVRNKDNPYRVVESFTIRELLDQLYGNEVPLNKLPSEWTELKIQDRSFPIIFILGYRFGLTEVLKFLNHPYRFIPEGTRGVIGIDEIAIHFADGKLVFPRYPLETGLVLAGLDRFKLRDYALALLDEPDTYFTLLSVNRLSTNYLKGIDSFFNLFVDAVTRDVLIRMGEPTTVKGLLLRATEMLATREDKSASSMANYRTRGYERLADIMYNSISRQIARYSADKGAKRTISLPPDHVLMEIMQDPTVMPAEEINPIHEIKQNSMVTYAGTGGRTAQSFVVSDRQYPEDAVGIISESTPDSGKVALNAYTSADPVFTNIRGMYDLSKAGTDKLEPANVLSVPALLMPGATQDDKL